MGLFNDPFEGTSLKGPKSTFLSFAKAATSNRQRNLVQVSSTVFETFIMGAILVNTLFLVRIRMT